MKLKARLLTAVIVGALWGNSIALGQELPAETTISPLNGLALPEVDPTEEFSFLLSSHLYGTPACKCPEKSGRARIFPAASFLANIDAFNELGPAFFAFLGDNMIIPRKHEKAAFQRHVSERLTMPIFNAPGNHDLWIAGPSGLPGALLSYQSFFGAPYYWFKIGNTAFVFLNTGSFSRADLDEEQVAWVLRLSRELAMMDRIRNVFFFSHKLIWLLSVRPMERAIVSQHPDYPRAILKRENFSTVYPAVRSLAQKKRVYWGSGDWLRTRRSFLYFENPADQITYFVNYLDDSGTDVFLKIHIQPEAVPVFTPISLATFESLELKEFTVHAGGAG